MIRIDIFQPIACYRIPEIGNPMLSFPLVPPATVYGLLRYITGYLPINKDNTRLAISGRYEGKTRHIVINHQTTQADKGKYKSNKVPIEELYNISHFIHVDSPYEKEILKAIYNAQRMGRREDVITYIACCEVEAATKNVFDINNTEISNIEAKMYAPFDSQISGIGVFKIPFDSDKALLDEGSLKMYYKRFFFMDVYKYYSFSNEVVVSKDKKGTNYLLCWLNE